MVSRLGCSQLYFGAHLLITVDLDAKLFWVHMLCAFISTIYKYIYDIYIYIYIYIYICYINLFHICIYISIYLIYIRCILIHTLYIFSYIYKFHMDISK